MKIRLSLLVVILMAVSLSSHALNIQLNPREDFCIYKKLASQEKLNINYVSSGQNEQKLMMKVFDLEGRIIKEISKQREGNVDITAEVGGSYRVCWRPMDNKPKMLSFDLTVGDAISKQAASPDNLDQVSQEVRKAYKSLEQVFRNQHYQHTREEVHRQAIESLESKIQWCAVIKIIVLVLIGVAQFYILTGFFKKRNNITV